MNLTGRCKVFRDENDKYFTYIKGNYLIDDGSQKSFFIRKKVRFPNGTEILNKSTIQIKEGWISTYRFETEENGEKKVIYGDYYFIKEFDLIEIGTQEKQKPQVFKKKEEKDSSQTQKTEENSWIDTDNEFVVPI